MAEATQEFTPYPFQQRVSELVLGGKNVILQAPTGSGKTAAALHPFLEAWRKPDEGTLPKKCIYAVPMRVLANQFLDEYAKAPTWYDADRYPRAAIQTGERPEDDTLKSDLIFATIDQVLSSFLLTPYSLPKRLSNLNAGAIIASYLVFDEFHLFDPLSTLPTTLEMLRMLRGVTPFILMTATFSRDMLQGLGRMLDAVVVPEDEAARRAIETLPSEQKTRRYHVAEEPLSAEAVLSKHQSRTLAICNVVDRARTLYEALRDHPDRGGAQIRLLHSRFLAEDRQRIEAEIREHFGKGKGKTGSWIVVATQVVEVGLDITCQTLHTELAPANSILQRAGRCARRKHEEGDVYVYSETFDATGEKIGLSERVMPYRDQEDEIARTLAEVQARCGQTLTFGDEQDIVSAAHGPRDRSTVQGLIAAAEMHQTKMTGVMDGQRSGAAGELIRAVSSRRVVVHDDPEEVRRKPFSAESFSLHPGTVYGLVQKWLTQERDLDLQGPGISALHDKGDVDEHGQSEYAWVPVRDKRDVAGSALVLVHPALAGYDPNMGFVPDRGTGYRAKLDSEQASATHSVYSYRLEAYGEHARLVYRAFLDNAWPEMAWAAKRLEFAFGWPDGILERAAHLVVLLHDVGKLNQAWQDWVVGYQSGIGLPVEPGCYAHTDYDPANPLHQQKQRAAGRKPPHAVEGAVATAPLLAMAVGECQPVFRAAFTAIARHHGAFTREYRRYSLVDGAERELGRTLSYLAEYPGTGLDTSALLECEDPARTPIASALVNPARSDEFLAYALLARVLRRADQSGTAMGSLSEQGGM